MGLKSLRVKTGSFNRLGLMERRLFREALLLHLRVWLILRFIPFRKIPELFADSGVSANENDIGLLEQIRKAVRRASGNSAVQKQMRGQFIGCKVYAEAARH